MYTILFPGPDSVSSDSISVISVTNSSIKVGWDKPVNGHVGSYEVIFECESPNSDFILMQPEFQSFNVTNTTASAIALAPGTVCKVNITPSLNDISGNQTNKDLENSSSEAGLLFLVSYLIFDIKYEILHYQYTVSSWGY